MQSAQALCVQSPTDKAEATEERLRVNEVTKGHDSVLGVVLENGKS